MAKRKALMGSVVKGLNHFIKHCPDKYGFPGSPLIFLFHSF